MKLDAIVLCIKVTIPPSVSRLIQLSLARVTILFLEQVSQKLGGQMNWGSEAYYGKDVDPPGEHLRNFSITKLFIIIAIIHTLDFPPMSDCDPLRLSSINMSMQKNSKGTAA